MGTFGIGNDEVRNKVGLTSSDVSNTITAQFISEAEFETEQLLKTKFTPKQEIELLDTPNSPEYVILNRTPVTRITNIQIGGTSGTHVDPSDTVLDNVSGKLLLKKTAGKTKFSEDEQERNTIEYYYAKMIETGTETKVSAETGTGDGTSFSVLSDVGFGSGDYIQIAGISGQKEITKCVGTSASTLIADLSWSHSANARVTLMTVPYMAKELARVLAAMRCAMYMVGSTYTFATSYSFPEHTVTKGVPYPHFEKLLNTLAKERDRIIEEYRPQFVVW